MTEKSTIVAKGTIELLRDGPILHVWLNRPAKHNALNTDVLEGIARGELAAAEGRTLTHAQAEQRLGRWLK